jgi:hypothetical protein
VIEMITFWASVSGGRSRIRLACARAFCKRKSRARASTNLLTPDIFDAAASSATCALKNEDFVREMKLVTRAVSKHRAVAADELLNMSSVLPRDPEGTMVGADLAENARSFRIYELTATGSVRHLPCSNALLSCQFVQL